MGDLINKYPYTDLHSVNLDYILKVVRENAGLHLEISGNQLLLKTADNTIISAITIPYATEAGSANSAASASYAAQAGSAASATYAATAGSATTATNATNATQAATADYASAANEAAHALTADSATHATSADTATNATNAANAQYAETTGYVEEAGNGIAGIECTETGQIWIDKKNGSTLVSSIKRAEKAVKDNLGNTINIHYIANVVLDNGTLLFKNATGSTIVSIPLSVDVASSDDYGNTLADYIKAIAVSSDSDYVTITHGTGATDTLQIHFSETAWKDTNGNVIKNTYIKRMEIIQDDDTGHYNLVAYNGDDPEAELFRFEINAYSAQIAAEANHAAEATNADYATEAQSAANATEAEECNTSFYIIKIQPDPNSPGDYEYVSCKNAAGESVDISEIQHDNLFNAFIEVYHSDRTPAWSEFYTVIDYGNAGPNSPYWFYATTHISESNGVESINRAFSVKSYSAISVQIYNGSATVDYEPMSFDMKYDKEALILTCATDVMSLAVNGTATATTEVEFDEIEGTLKNGVNIYDICIGDSPTNEYTAHLSYNAGDVEFFIWDKVNNVNKRFTLTAGGQDDEITITRTF